ncbi:hypothetical protein E0Z10_g8048 [Xylaria hypoxylon]|uniref:Glucose-methanol-choline oxidoreductase C-terminal domain-containing protein n=1 Tax=Xylaria hypoxylon TaxID=37992 RepID=A0A4Z0YWC8_9PEZI|nr:hypothetical protein E0Z10_g8048 [Xylaria hypoxylon]
MLAAQLGCLETNSDAYRYPGIPRSRGTVAVTSADSAVHPVIDRSYFSDHADIEVGVARFKRARKFGWSKTMKPFLTEDREAFPGAHGNRCANRTGDEEELPDTLPRILHFRNGVEE